MYSSDKSAVNAETLEGKLLAYLGIPRRQIAVPTRGIAEKAEAPGTSVIRELRRELFELRKEASQIGRIPLEYPTHIVMIMKIISALLPWYTRPLLHFAQRVSRTADLTSHVLEEVLKTQEHMAAELFRIRQSMIPLNADSHRDTDGALGDR